MASTPNPVSGGLKLSRLILILLMLTLVGIVFYRYYNKNLKDNTYTFVPKELQIRYQDADFQFELDEENALAILSNPRRYRREFDNLVYDINMAILRHVADRMGLASNLRTQLEDEYQKHHPYLRKLYYEDFVNMADTTSNLYQAWYDNESTNAADVLNEVASKYTCFFVNQVMMALVENRDGNLYGVGKNVDTPCGIALTEGLKPLMARMKERAQVADFGRSRGLLQQRVEKAIAELATMEVRDKKGINKQLQTRIWGFAVSSSDLELSAISILKVGFRLNEYFDVSLSTSTNSVVVTLPEPTILSHEVYPRIDKLDIGWLREVQGVDFNESLNLLREEFRREAYENDVMDKAKKQAVEVVRTMFEPLFASINRKYKLEVRFREGAPDPAYEKDDDSFSDLDSRR